MSLSTISIIIQKINRFLVSKWINDQWFHPYRPNKLKQKFWLIKKLIKLIIMKKILEYKKVRRVLFGRMKLQFNSRRVQGEYRVGSQPIRFFLIMQLWWINVFTNLLLLGKKISMVIHINRKIKCKISVLPGLGRLPLKRNFLDKMPIKILPKTQLKKSNLLNFQVQ